MRILAAAPELFLPVNEEPHPPESAAIVTSEEMQPAAVGVVFPVRAVRHCRSVNLFSVTHGSIPFRSVEAAGIHDGIHEMGRHARKPSEPAGNHIPGIRYRISGLLLNWGTSGNRWKSSLLAETQGFEPWIQVLARMLP